MKPIKSHYLWLIGALLAGFCARVPGVFWGANFPAGWYGHHVDEYTHLVNAEIIINPTLEPRWPPHHYPKAMAAHAALPLIAGRVVQGNALAELPSPQVIISTGRIFAVFYGVATILIVYFLALMLTKDVRVALIAAWLLALGGLHVTQSHFFLSDVPGIFWYLLGLCFLWRELEHERGKTDSFLYAGAVCLGAAGGLKLVPFAVPTLALAAILRRPRLPRLFFAGMLFIAGFGLINAGVYTTIDLAKTVGKGISDPYEFTTQSTVFLYLIELPSVVSFPFLLLALTGALLLTVRFFQLKDSALRFRITLVVLLPLALTILSLLKVDHFPRHLVPLIPWMAIAAAWALVAIANRLHTVGVPQALVVVPVFLYLAVFVYDGERVFIDEPRNQAAEWVLRNVPKGTSICWTGHDWIPGYEHLEFPDKGRPDVMVIEMHTANHYLSGMSWRNSYPSDYKKIFASRSQKRVEELQSVFKGDSEYQEVARFHENYFMPEYWLAETLIGNTSRNYVAEMVIFDKRDTLVTSSRK